MWGHIKFALLAMVVAIMVRPEHPEAAGIDSNLVGWAIVDISEVQRDSGTGFKRVIFLSNGMVFEISGIGLPVLPFTKVILLAKKFTAEDIRKMGLEDTAEKMPDGIVLMKILIDDDVYDAQRLR